MSAIDRNVVAKRAAYPARVRLEGPARHYPPVLLEPGEYKLAYAQHRIDRQYDRGVLAVYFVTIELLPDINVLCRYFNVEALTAKDKNGKRKRTFVAARGSDLVAEYRQLFPYRRMPRLDRIPIAWLAEQYVVGNVGTVTTNRNGDPIDEKRYHSVVKELVRCS